MRHFAAIIVIGTAMLAAGPVSGASAHQHHGQQSMSGHESDAKDGHQRMSPLPAVPRSGQAREAGFDASYFMEDTGLIQNIDRLCALGSRGLVQVDNATWAKCGGKTKGIPDFTGHAKQTMPMHGSGEHAGH